jgi:hypothetical protein
MPDAVCHFPVTLKIHGELTDDRIADLAAGFESALAARLDAARREVARRRRAGPVRRGEGPGGEPLDRARLTSVGGSYLLPSFGPGQTATEGASRTGGAPAFEFPPEPSSGPVLAHPATEPRQDLVYPHPSAFEGDTVVIFPERESGYGWKGVFVASPRYAVAGDLSRAIGWGNLLFGARSFAILEGPFGTPESRYHVVGVGPTISDADILGASEPDEQGRFTFKARYWQEIFKGAAGEPYRLRALFTREGHPLFPMNRFWFEEYLKQIQATDPRLGLVSPAWAAPMVFGEIDALIMSDETEQAARRLSELDANAFRIVDWETRARYIKVLVDAWTWESQEVAIVELMRASQDRSELVATIELLKKAGVYEQLFHDLNSQLFSLLVMVGKEFADPGPVTFEFLLGAMMEAGLLPKDADELARRVALGPMPDVLEIELLAELEEAAYGFVNFLGGTLESVVMIVTEPGKVLEGVGQLAKLAYTVELARWGHAPSILYLAKLLQGVGEQVTWGLKGAQFLGVSGAVARRLKWALIWEVASWFVGVGEVAAVVKGLAGAERGAMIAKFLGVLRRVGSVARGEKVIERLPRLARVMKNATNLIEHEDEVLRLLAHLPEEDVARLGKVLDEAETLEELTMAALRARNPEAGEAAAAALRKIEVLKALASKAGGLSEEVAAVFGRLVRADRFGIEEAAEIVKALPEGEFKRFARALDAIPAESLGRGGSGGADLVRGLASSPKRMNAVGTIGYDAYRALESRAAGKLDVLDEHLDTLAELESKFAAADRYPDYRRYLDRLGEGNSRAWDHLEGARHRPPGQRELPVSFDVESEWARYDAMRRRPLAELNADSDPLAKQVVDDYYGKSADELERLSKADDPLATEVLDSKLGGKSRRFVPERPSNPEVQARLRGELEQFRREVEAARPEPLQAEPPDWSKTVPTTKQSRRYRGTVGVAESDIPALQGRKFRGASPEAGGTIDPNARIKPGAELAKVTQAHGHAEQDLAAQIDKALQSLSAEDYELAKGRTISFRIDQEVCSTCAAALAGGPRDGVLAQLSKLHPDIAFEITADDTSKVFRLRGGVRVP